MNQDDVSTLGNGTSGGISIEDPNLFSYNGRWYLFMAELTNPDKSIGSVRLVNRCIDYFEYVNEINSICMTGKIRYTDVDGQVSKFFNYPDSHLVVRVKQMQKKEDGSGDNRQEIFVDMDRGKESSFQHSFIVQNMAIVDRQGQAITYELSLISTLWYKACPAMAFSNYSTKEGKTRPKNIIEIMECLFVDNGLQVDPKGFENAKATSKISLDYATSANDTIETALQYLFNKLLYSKEQQDDSLKFIAYNPIDNLFRLVNYNDVVSWPTIAKPTIILSLFETQYERSLYARNNQMASVVAKKQTESSLDFFKRVIWKYDTTLNSLDFMDTSFETADLFSFANEYSKSFESEAQGGPGSDPWIPKKKYPDELNKEWYSLYAQNRYKRETSLWNNDGAIYRDILDNMVKRDAIVINTDGDVTHQPGCVIGVVLDRTLEKSDDISPSQLEELKKKHRQLEGLAQIFKVRHIYKPSTPNPYYTENIVFGRNFLLETTGESKFKAISETIRNFGRNFLQRFRR